MGLFTPGPYGGAPPWAEAAMLLGSGLVSGGAPGGGGIGGLGPAFASMSQAGNRQAQRARMAKTDKRLEKAEGLQQAKFRYEQEQDLMERQQKWRAGAAFGLPPEVLGPMPGTMEATQASGQDVLIPETGPQAKAGGIMYDPGAGEAGLMPPPPSGLMGEGYFQSLPKNIQGVVGPIAAADGIDSAVRLAETMQKDPRRQTKLEQQIEAARASGMNQDDINTMLSNSLRYSPGIDPITQQPIHRDLLKMGVETGAVPPTAPAPVPAAPPGTPPLPAPAEPTGGLVPPPGGYEQGFGTQSFATNLANKLTGALGLPLVSREVQEAVTEIDTLGTRTMLELSEGIPGRPSNLTREEVKGMAPVSTAIFGGDEEQEIRVNKTLNLLESQVKKWTEVSEDPNIPADQRQAAINKVKSIEELRDSYRTVQSNFYAPTEYVDMSDKELFDMIADPNSQLDPTQARRELTKRRAQKNKGAGLMGGS